MAARDYAAGHLGGDAVRFDLPRGRPVAGGCGRRRLTPMAAIARIVALDTLRHVHAGQTDLASALERGRARLSDERDQALAAEISLGTLRWRAALDHAIAWAGDASHRRVRR